MSDQQTDPMALNLNDFQNVVKLVDMAAQRGAIRGDEMVILGTLRQKFVTFLEKNGQEQPAPPQEVEEATHEDKATEG